MSLADVPPEIACTCLVVGTVVVANESSLVPSHHATAREAPWALAGVMRALDGDVAMIDDRLENLTLVRPQKLTAETARRDLDRIRASVEAAKERRRQWDSRYAEPDDPDDPEDPVPAS
jgi:hypothetical protein